MSETRRLLLCSHNPLTRELGVPKVLIELARELEPFGWVIEFISPKDLGVENASVADKYKSFAEGLRKYLRVNSGRFDVVDYDHSYLPYPRNEFAMSTLMVSRSVLLAHHFQRLTVPNAPGLRPLAARIVRGRTVKKLRDEIVDLSTRTLQEADLVNVCNDHDKVELTSRGIDASKIVVIPFGLTQARFQALQTIDALMPKRPVVAFVGTFDYRKGAREFPEILRRLSKSVPDVRMKLLGTEGLFRTKERVLSAFPAELRERLEIHPTFKADELPALLRDCSLGIFPSHVEGFPFGVLEMLASALPVIAYDAPGPPMMLPKEWLVARGDAAAMADKAAQLLCNSTALTLARNQARASSKQFNWESAAALTDKHYRAAIARHLGIEPSLAPEEKRNEH